MTASRRSVLVVAGVVAIGIAFATTTDRPWVGPSYVVLSVGFAIVAACLLAPEKLRPAAGIAGAVASGVAAGHVLFTPGMPRVHDIGHLWGIWAYGRCVAEGVYFPTWIPYLGAGIPLFEFYGPLNFLSALPGILAGLSPVSAWKSEMMAAHVLSSISVLLSVRLLGAGWRSSLLAAIALAFAPWRLAVFDYRGALGEANAFLFLPLVAASTIRMWSRPGRVPGIVLALSASALVLTHVVSLFTLLVILVPALFGLQVAARESAVSWRERLRVFVLPWIAVAGLSAAWWIPVVLESRYTSLERTTKDNPYYLYADHGVRSAALFERRLWDRLRVSLPETARREQGFEGEQMPFYTGAILMLLALASPYWSRRAETRVPAVAAFLGLVLSTSPLAHALASMPGFGAVRFPWRFLSPATVMASLALGLGAESWMSERTTKLKQLALPMLLVAGLIADAAPYTGAADRIPPYEGVVHWHTTVPSWTHWETSVKPERIDWSAENGIVRVRNLELPPSRYATSIDSFFPGYYEWLTPEIYETYWRSQEPGVLAQAGVRYLFAIGREKPVRIAERPYATLETGDGILLPRSFDRKPGRIVVEVSDSPAAAWLVVLEQAFPGWEARIDGGEPREPATVRGFLAVDLPAGARRVELSYGMRTLPRRAGLCTSLATLIVGTFVLLWKRRAR